MNSNISARGRSRSRVSASRVAVVTSYTLCDDTPRLRPVAAVGRLDNTSDDAATYAAYFATAAEERTVVDQDELIILGSELPPPRMVLVPFITRLLMSLDHVDIGWTGYVVGSGVVARTLLALAPVVGARHLIDLDATDLGLHSTDHAGESVFLVTDTTERRLINLLAAIPDRSMVVQLVPVEDSSALPVNFYDTIHKKSLSLIGQDRIAEATQHRARRLVETRLAALDLDIPLQAASEERKIEGDGPAGVILDWT